MPTSTEPTEPSSSVVSPPVAPIERTTREIHGTVLVDDYAYRRERKDARVIPHLEAENAFTRARMSDTDALQERLYTEILGMRPEMRGRVIFMTGDLIDEEISGFLSQVDAVSIPKPLDVPSVLAAVAETLERR